MASVAIPLAGAPSLGEARAAVSSSRFRAAPRWLLFALLIFFVMEYVRPTGLVQLKLQGLVAIVLPILWVSARNRPRSRALILQLAFVGLCAVGVLHANNYFAAYVATRTMFGNVGIALGISWVLSDRTTLREGVGWWTVVMVYVGWYALTHGGRGTGGFLGDENDVALALCAALPFAFFGFERGKGARKILYAVGGLIMVAAIVKSASRGGFLGLVGAGAYCFFTSRRKLMNLGILAIATAGFLLLASPAYLEELATIQDTDSGTANTRRFLWTTAWEMYLENPVIGVGGSNFNYLAGDFQPRTGKWAKPEYTERNWKGTTVHSFYFQLLSEQGSVGVFLVAAVAWLHFTTLRRLRRDVAGTAGVPPDLVRETEQFAGSLVAGMVGFLVGAAFISVLYYPYLWHMSGFAVALDAAVRRELAALPRSG